jgi:hypothetical protein
VSVKMLLNREVKRKSEQFRERSLTGCLTRLCPAVDPDSLLFCSPSGRVFLCLAYLCSALLQGGYFSASHLPVQLSIKEGISVLDISLPCSFSRRVFLSDISLFCSPSRRVFLSDKVLLSIKEGISA